MGSSHSTVVDVGTPPSEFHDNEWTTTEVRYHGFAGLTTVREEGMASVDLTNKSEKSIQVKFGFSVNNLEYKAVAARDGSTHGLLFQPYGNVCTWRINNFAKHSDLLGALVEGTLVIEVRMKRSDSTPPSPPFTAENPFNSMMHKMFIDEETADVMFEVGGHTNTNAKKKAKTSPSTFFAHRLILKKCAPMLAELCGTVADMTQIKITDITPEIFRHVLYYVYGGKVAEEDLKFHAKEIIDAADRLGVVSLKLETEVWYFKSTKICVDNVMDNLLYADAKNCALLKEAVMEFMVNHGGDILKKVSLKDAPGGLLADLLTALTRKENKNEECKESSDELSLMRISDLRRKLHEKGMNIDGYRETLIATLEETA